MKKHPYGIIVLVFVFLLLPSNTYGKAKKSDIYKKVLELFPDAELMDVQVKEEQND